MRHDSVLRKQGAPHRRLERREDEPRTNITLDNELDETIAERANAVEEYDRGVLGHD